jgi:dynein heavy chain
VFEEELIFAQPIIFCHFADGIGDPKYMPIRDWPHLQNLLKDALTNYNELVTISISELYYKLHYFNVFLC